LGRNDKALAETLVGAEDRWRQRGDGMRQAPVVDPGVRVDTVERMGGLYDRIVNLQANKRQWRER
jgi:hypothetical protein